MDVQLAGAAISVEAGRCDKLPRPLSTQAAVVSSDGLSMLARPRWSGVASRWEQSRWLKRDHMAAAGGGRFLIWRWVPGQQRWDLLGRVDSSAQRFARLPARRKVRELSWFGPGPDRQVDGLFLSKLCHQGRLNASSTSNHGDRYTGRIYASQTDGQVDHPAGPRHRVAM